MLGGSRYLIPVIKAAHELGCYVITCDYLPSNIAHKYADYYQNESIIDKDKILELAIKMNIDAIMSFACDPGVVTAAFVAEKLGLSTNPYDAVKILQNKEKFRKFLKDNSFSVPMAKGYLDIESVYNDISLFSWPVMVKPIDSAGSKGVSKVDSPEDIEIAFKIANSNSILKRVIIEDFIEKDGFSSDTDCFSINGKLVYSSFSDQGFDEYAPNPYTPVYYNWPSTMQIHAQCILKNELQRLVSILKLTTSIYNVETRLGKNGIPYIMEFSPRGGGNRLAEMLEYSSGVELIKNSVRAALGDPIIGISHDPVYNGFWSEYILHSNYEGVFDNVYIDNAIQQYVKQIDLWVKKGEKIERFTGANTAIGTVVLSFANQSDQIVCMNNIGKLIKVILG